MSEQWQIRKGTNTENISFTGALGEVTMDIDRKELHLHDGSTIGGKVLGRDYMTNCITEIPQDIKIEINTNGQLVVKAGSKAYIPNGVGTFIEVTVATDQVWTADSYNHDEMFFIKTDGTLARQNTNMLSSGATNVMGDTSTYCHCYNTTDNKIYSTQDGGSTWTETNESFPIALVTKNNSKFVQIKQIFNGFGYIGSAVFVLPGVKGLISDGRNTDGTLKSTQCTVSVVKVHSFGNGSHCLMLDRNGNIVVGNNFYYDVNLSDLSSSDCVYLSDRNEVWRYGSGGLYIPHAALAFTTYISGGAVTSFNPKTAFHAIDYSEADFVAAFQRPTTENSYTWYRKYKSGWVEQGGSVEVPGTGGVNAIFPIKMLNTNYNVQITGYVTADSDMNQDTFWCTHRYTDKIGID